MKFFKKIPYAKKNNRKAILKYRENETQCVHVP